MDYTEIIEREALKYSEEKWKHPSSNLSRAHCSLDFEAGIKSNISKQITEIEKLEAKIGAYKEIAMISYCSELLSQILYEERMDLEQLRDKLITELNPIQKQK